VRRGRPCPTSTHIPRPNQRTEWNALTACSGYRFSPHCPIRHQYQSSPPSYEHIPSTLPLPPHTMQCTPHITDTKPKLQNTFGGLIHHHPSTFIVPLSLPETDHNSSNRDFFLLYLPFPSTQTLEIFEVMNIRPVPVPVHVSK